MSRRPAAMILWLLASLLPATAFADDTPPVPAAPPPPPGCTEPVHAQFDFWIGEWQVHAGDTLAGHNTIVRALDGCALTEHWRGAGDSTGHSLNAYDRASGKWKQFWIGNRGGVLELAGGLQDDGSMLMRSAADAAGVVQQVRWSAEADGSVRQRWTAIAADGSSTTVFDGRYTRVE